jgi:hypothetical protein
MGKAFPGEIFAFPKDFDVSSYYFQNIISINISPMNLIKYIFTKFNNKLFLIVLEIILLIAVFKIGKICIFNYTKQYEIVKSLKGFWRQ